MANLSQGARSVVRTAHHSFNQKERIMKMETPTTTENSHELFVLSAVFIGLGILLHRLFFLVALIFAFVAAMKGALAQIAGSIFHRRCL
jgi:hypothetical protein